ncbi:hypothetical protein BGI41_06955 [Methanobrevibacter sp. 87.7]|uniref:hypothetical protein n=1 Tax=Methanobrevibacter sp. 87.7 TaxID=387957 RepID=UPI000B509237|nr:hypothetical protein [Methanobrevibacter sp. 87.7]OWT32576.1 hypothetical protein BGI41_06955 [Methanobrevibacter sp. 87.7]
MLNKRSILLIITLLILCLCISTVSAADNNSLNINQVPNNESISSNSNINMVSENSLISDNVKENQKSSIQSNIRTSENTYVSNAVKNNKNSTILSDSETPGTFNDLKKLITNTPENGTLTLDKDYTFNGSVDNYEISINKAIIIDGNNHILNGNNLSEIISVQAEKVVLKNINFINGYSEHHAGGIYWGKNNGTIINCTFINNHGESSCGAIYWNGHYGTIENSTFINNTAGANGGAVYWFAYFGEIKNSTFINNTAENLGRSIFIFMNKLQVSNCTFIDNKDNLNLGDVYYYYCLNSNKLPPGKITYTTTNTSIATNNYTLEDVSKYIKVLFYNYPEYSDQNRVWVFTNKEFRNSNDTIIQKVIHDVDVDHLILNDTPIKWINETDYIQYNFIGLKLNDIYKNYQNLISFKMENFTINTTTQTNNTNNTNYTNNNTNYTNHTNNNTNNNTNHTNNHKKTNQSKYESTTTTYKTGNPLYLLLIALLSLIWIPKYKN